MALGFDPISAGIGVVGNIVSGIFGNAAANKAAKLQEQAAKDAAGRTDRTTQAVNADLISAGNTTGTQLRQAAGEATARVDEGTGRANDLLAGSTTQANLLLDPYRQTGEQSNTLLAEGLQPGGDFNKTPGLADLQIDPGYAFRQEQANKALLGTAAARGGAQGGGTTRDILALNSGLASQEYQNAFERFRQSAGDRFSRLSTTADRGVAVAGEQGLNLITSGTTQANNITVGSKYGADLNYRSTQDAGNINFGAAEEAGRNSLQGTRDVNELLTSGAAARAGGIVGGANALGAGIAGGANAVVGQRNLQNLLKNPYGGPYRGYGGGVGYDYGN